MTYHWYLLDYRKPQSAWLDHALNELEVITATGLFFIWFRIQEAKMYLFHFTSKPKLKLNWILFQTQIFDFCQYIFSPLLYWGDLLYKNSPIHYYYHWKTTTIIGNSFPLCVTFYYRLSLSNVAVYFLSCHLCTHKGVHNGYVCLQFCL